MYFQSITAQNGIHIGCEIKYIPKLKQIVYRSYECTKENKNQIEYDHVEIEISDPTSEESTGRFLWLL